MDVCGAQHRRDDEEAVQTLPPQGRAGHMWKVLKVTGRQLSVRIPSKSVDEVLSTSGQDGIFWKVAPFTLGRELLPVLPLKKAVDRRSAINAARKCCGDVLGVVLGQNRLLLAREGEQQDDGNRSVPLSVIWQRCRDEDERQIGG